MRTTYITATVIALALAAWLLSGTLGQSEREDPASVAQQNRDKARVEEDIAPTKVRVTVIDAQPFHRNIKIRGKTENKRTVQVKMELAGSVVARPVERGTIVEKDQVLCQLSVEDRDVALIEAKAALNQARIEYQGALRLQEKGFNSETAIAAARARLAASQANLSRRELDLTKLHVRAPFGGIVEDVHQEIGDFVSPGAACATVVDMDPMLLVGRVSEQDVISLALGNTATGYLRDGTVVTGPVTFIGQQSDATTRTYPVEIQVANADAALRSGITTEIHIPVESVLAQKVSPALFALDDTGGIGIRTVNADNVVEFYNVEILADADDGVWVAGLPSRAAIIVVGQELVSPGELVDPQFVTREQMRPATISQHREAAPVAGAATPDQTNVSDLAHAAHTSAAL